MESLKENKNVIIVCLILIISISILYFIRTNDINKETINNEYNYIKKYKSNEFIPVYITEEDMAKVYLNEYKNYMIFNREDAYNVLNKEYREKKFGSYDKYVEYLNEIVSLKTYELEVDKYSVSIINGNKIFDIYDTYGNEYIIKEKSIMNFEVYLDKETINIE